MTVSRLNHAVLYVRDARQSAAFYTDVLGFEVSAEMTFPSGGSAVFLRAASSPNDHDLGLFSVGQAAGDTAAGRTTVGMYHLAWEVRTLGELAALEDRLAQVGSLVGKSDHGVSKSLYAKDPDGLEFEVMWAVPPDLITADDDPGRILPLDLAKEIERFGADTAGRVTAPV